MAGVAGVAEAAVAEVAGVAEVVVEEEAEAVVVAEVVVEEEAEAAVEARGTRRSGASRCASPALQSTRPFRAASGAARSDRPQPGAGPRSS